MKNLKYIHQNSYSFVLADGVAPFQVIGLVETTILFGGSITNIQAHIARNLCASMIIGMDYINKYNLNINVKQQTISIENTNRIFTLNIDSDYDLRKIPVTTSKSIYIPPHSNRSIKVSNPISSIYSSFVPTFYLHNNISLRTKYTYLTFQNYYSNVSFFNSSSVPKILSKGACVGYLQRRVKL